MYDYRADVEAAGANYPIAKRYYVVVDSGSDIFTGKSFPGSYTLRFWIDDLKPPTISLMSTTVASGRPTIVATAKDAGSGIDPLSLVLNYNGNVLIGAAAYDPTTGIALFPIPSAAPTITAGKKTAIVQAADNEETKNVNPPPGAATPNTTAKAVTLTVANRPELTWLVPDGKACLRTTTRLAVVASSNKKLTKVTFRDGKKTIGSQKPDVVGVAFKDWNAKRAAKGKHTLVAVARDASGRTVTVSRIVRVCK
jgi:hypothetical protein